MNPVKKNLTNTSSRKLAINAMCAHCHGCTEEWSEPGWIEEVRNCRVTSCPLWRLRPYTPKEGGLRHG